MARLIITESEKNNIHKMYGLIMEQGKTIVSIEKKIPITSGKDENGDIVDTTDWDGVHAIFSSKRKEYSDNLVSRVEPYLQTEKFRVTDVKISSEKNGKEITTKGSVTLTPISQGQKPHIVFTTRGSLGNDYVNRYDKQVNGLENRIKSTYGSTSVETFGPFDVKIKNTKIKYKQIFYAADSNQPQSKTNQQQNKPKENIKTVINPFRVDYSEIQTGYDDY
jgi:hypothetical protein